MFHEIGVKDEFWTDISHNLWESANMVLVDFEQNYLF